jgi:hypothetical protein
MRGTTDPKHAATFDIRGITGSTGGQDRDDENCPEQAERLCGAIAELL